MKVKVINCYRKEYIGKIVDVYYKYSNGIDFITPYGLIFLSSNDFEIEIF